MKQGTPSSGLYLRIRPDAAMDDILPKLRQAAFVINRSEYEKNMHVIEVAPKDQPSRESATALIQIAKMEGLVAVLRGDAETALALEADGVLLEDVAAAAAARDMMKEKIVGAVCGNSRAAADEALAAGVDLVAFGVDGLSSLPPASLFHWWSTRTDIPSLACGPLTNDDAAIYVGAGATFLDCTDYVWEHPKGVMQGVSNMLYAIELASETTKVN